MQQWTAAEIDFSWFYFTSNATCLYLLQAQHVFYSFIFFLGGGGGRKPTDMQWNITQNFLLHELEKVKMKYVRDICMSWTERKKIKRNEQTYCNMHSHQHIFIEMQILNEIIANSKAHRLYQTHSVYPSHLYLFNV